MTPDFDLTDAPRLDWAQVQWFARQTLPDGSRLPREALTDLAAHARIVRGVRAPDGRFDPQPEGRGFIAFDQGDDVVLWQPNTGELATWQGRAFALGENAIISAATYSFDNCLVIHADPLEWLTDLHGSSIVVLDWSQAFDRLRDAPRVAIAEELLPLYQQHMRPPRMPELFIIPNNRRAAA